MSGAGQLRQTNTVFVLISTVPSRSQAPPHGRPRCLDAARGARRAHRGRDGPEPGRPVGALAGRQPHDALRFGGRPGRPRDPSPFRCPLIMLLRQSPPVWDFSNSRANGDLWMNSERF